MKTTFPFLLVGALAAGCQFDRAAVVNSPPVADAGDDVSVTGGEQVMLTGSATDPDDDPSELRWEQLAGHPVEISDLTSAQITFTAPSATTTLVLSLTANDGFEDGPPDLVNIAVVHNTPPVAAAGGYQEVRNLASIRLDGTGTDVDGDTITAYQWTVVAGPPQSSLTALLSGADTKNPVFTPDTKGDYTVSLMVSDSHDAWSLPDNVLITALNNPPVANAGNNQEIVNGDTLALLGSATDPDGDEIDSYTWSVIDFPPGADFQLVPDATAGAADFTPDGKGLYTLGLMANDGEHVSAVSTVIVRATNNPPTADAGEDTEAPNLQTVYLPAAGADPDGDPLSFRWTVVSTPVGATPTVSGTTSSELALTLRGVGAYTIELSAGDGTTWSAADTVVVDAQNNAPVAHAGEDLTGLSKGETFVLDGGGSFDPDGHELTHTWTQLSGTPVTGTLTGPNPILVVGDQLETLTFELVVNDGYADSAADTVLVHVDNSPPICDAGPDQIVIAGQEVTLDGSGSADLDVGDEVVGYSWTQISGEEVSLSGVATATPTFTAPAFEPGESTLVFELWVTDGSAQSPTDQVAIVVTPDEASFYFVDVNAADGGDGSRATPFNSPTAALTAASSDGMDVVVGAGTYGRFNLTNGVRAIGGFDPVTWVYDPAQFESVVDSTTATTTIYVGTAVQETAELNSFTVYKSGGDVDTYGIHVIALAGCANVTLRNNEFIFGNIVVARDKRAVSLIRCDNVLLENNLLVTGTGDILQNLTVTLEIFESNNTVARNNRVELYGIGCTSCWSSNAIRVRDSGPPLIDGNEVVVTGAATCTDGSFGIAIYDTVGSRITNNAIIVGTTGCPAAHGIGLFNSYANTIVSNNTISGVLRNSSVSEIALYLPGEGLGDVRFFNNIVEQFDWVIYEGTLGAPDVTVSMRANALTNVDHLYYDRVEGTVDDMTAIEALPILGGLPDSEGNLEVDCAVGDPDAGDYSLSPTSPCIDQGDRLTGVPDQDMDGNSRPTDLAPDNYADGTDIGAVEMQP